MKTILVDGKSWWVPEARAWRLAVQIDSAEEYLPAIERKLLELIEAAGPFSEALDLVGWVMEPQGVRITPTADPDDLVAQVLATSSVGEMVRSGSPWCSRSAPSDEAIDAVETQGELTLAEFLA